MGYTARCRSALERLSRNSSEPWDSDRVGTACCRFPVEGSPLRTVDLCGPELTATVSLRLRPAYEPIADC